MPIPTVRLRVRHGSRHPWIFYGMTRDWDDGIKAGDWVRVVDREREFVGYGFANRRSQISVRLVSFDPKSDDPAACVAERIRQAVALRRDTLALDGRTNAWRVVNSEGDGLPGLVADRYGDAIVLELFSIWPLVHAALVEPPLQEAFPGARIFLRSDSRIQDLEGFRAPADRMPKGMAEITDERLRFRVNLSGHKTGAFLDQRENHKLAAAFARGRAVLDGCCYGGGFALHATAAGAAAVTGVDLDEKAIEAARENARLNKAATADWVHADLFPYLRDARRHKKKWGLVILDPPKFAANRDELKRGLDKYFDLNRAALDVVEPGGILVTCSCSGVVSDETFLAMLSAVSHAARRTIQVLRVAHAAPDHPFQAACQESRYLKVVFARVL